MHKEKTASASRDGKRSIRRLFIRTVRLSAVITTAIAIYRICAFAEEKRREFINREKRRSSIVALAVSLSALAVSVGALMSLTAELKRRGGGYVFDLFDRDEYEIISPDEEDEIGSVMNGELDDKSEVGEGNVYMSSAVKNSVPIDEEASLESYR